MSKVNPVLAADIAKSCPFIKGVADSSFNNRFTKLMGNKSDITEVNCLKDFIRSIFYPVWGLPLDLFNGCVKKLAEKFPNNKLLESINNWSFLKKYRLKKFEAQGQRTARGIVKNFYNTPNVVKKNVDKLAEDILKVLNKNAGPDVAKYNTRDERVIARLVSSLVPIIFLYNDSFNISKKNGVSDEKAHKMAKNKRNQELISSFGESWAQLAILGGFPEFNNNSQYGAPIINTAIGTVFNIFSRMKTGRSLTPLKLEDVEKKQPPQYSPFMTEFINRSKDRPFAKFGFVSDKVMNFYPNKKADINDTVKGKEKHLISLKNLVKFCLISIGAGFSLKFTKGKIASHIKNNPGSRAAKFFNNAWSPFYKKLVTKNIEVTKSELEKFYGVLKHNVKGDAFKNLSKKTNDAFDISTTGRITLGEVDRTIKIPFFNIDMKVKKLIEVPFAPLRILYEFFCYPYKTVKSILEQTNVIKKIKKEPENLSPFSIEHLYNNYKNFALKFKDEKKLQKVYKEFFEKNFDKAFDMEQVSKVNNAKAAKLSQLIGAAGSIYFAVNDDYNQTLIETGDINKARHDRRKRGVQRFTRIVTQLAVLDCFNQVFIHSYNGSLLGAAVLTAACTYSVDRLTRLLNGQSTKRLSAEELKIFEEKKRKGVAGQYYKLLDRLSM